MCGDKLDACHRQKKQTQHVISQPQCQVTRTNTVLHTLAVIAAASTAAAASIVLRFDSSASLRFLLWMRRIQKQICSTATNDERLDQAKQASKQAAAGTMLDKNKQKWKKQHSSIKRELTEAAFPYLRYYS
jgi:acyl-homoserine lactone acylase PvdQ